jgi:hypothetical protein
MSTQQLNLEAEKARAERISDNLEFLSRVLAEIRIKLRKEQDAKALKDLNDQGEVIASSYFVR